MASKTIKIAVSAILLVILIAIAAYITVSRLMIKLADNDYELPKGYENRTKEELNAWLEWKGKTDRSYYCDKNANLQRQGIFISNLRYIKSFNNRNRSFKLAPNKFADMTNEEINKLYIGPMIKWSTVLLPLGDPAQFQINADRNDGVKGPVDWASKSSFVHDQGMCRAGAAYAAAANIESYYNLVNRTSSGAKEFKISMQQMLDCLLVGNKDSAPVCSGGVSSVSVYETLEMMAGDFVDEGTFNSYINSLPAKHQLTPNCFVNITIASAKQQTDIARSKVLSFGVIDKGNITEALRVLGPLTVGIDASKSSFHFYDSGIYYDDSCDTSSFNHHMLIVGHTEGSSSNDNQAEPTGKKLQQAHYLMKNSFGPSWGEKGFIRFLIDNQANKCLPQGIATYPNLSA